MHMITEKKTRKIIRLTIQILSSGLCHCICSKLYIYEENWERETKNNKIRSDQIYGEKKKKIYGE